MIQTKKEIPKTHFFIYEGKQYPFNLELFKFSSDYFLKNEAKINEGKYIQLLDQNDLYTSIKEEYIQNFIQYIHRESIPLNDENAVILNFLANKYELYELVNTTNDYISSHHSAIALNHLVLHQKNSLFDSSLFENIISTHLLDYINDERILELDISILFRIIKKYQENKNHNKLNENEENKIIEFLFKCLEKFGRPASILFNDIDIDKVKIEYMNLLITKYSSVFDFHFINSNLLKSLYERSNHIIQFMQKNEGNNENVSNTIKSLEEKIKKYQIELNDYKNKNDEMKNEIEILKKQMIDVKNEQSEKIKSMKDDLDKEKVKNNELLNQFEKLKQEFATLKNNELQKIKDEIEECKKISEENQNKNDANENADCVISVPYQSGDQNRFNGIFTKLGNGDASKALSDGLVNITGSSIYNNQNHYLPKNVLIYSDEKLYFGSEDIQNSWLQVDFNKHIIKLSHYSFKSNHWGDKGHFHLQNWDIEGSNDSIQWDLLDSRRSETSIDGLGASNTFEVNNKTNKDKYYRYIRIQQKGKNTANNDRIIIACIEFFGQVKKI